MKCEKCGFVFNEDTSSCPRCGNLLPKKQIQYRHGQESGAIDKWQDDEHFPIEYEEDVSKSAYSYLWQDNNFKLCASAIGCRLFYYLVLLIAKLLLIPSWILLLINVITIGIVVFVFIAETPDTQETLPIGIMNGVLIGDILIQLGKIIIWVIKWILNIFL